MARGIVPASVRHHFDPLYTVRVVALTKQDGGSIGTGRPAPIVSNAKLRDYRFAGFKRITLEGMGRSVAGELGRVVVEFDLAPPAWSGIAAWLDTGQVIHRTEAVDADGWIIASCGQYCDQTNGGPTPTHTYVPEHLSRCRKCWPAKAK